MRSPRGSLIVAVCMAGGAGLPAPGLAQGFSSAASSMAALVAPARVDDPTWPLLAQSAVPSGDARRDAAGVERDESRRSRPSAAPAPSAADAVTEGPAPVERKAAGADEVAPHYVFDVDAPTALRQLIERQTTIAKWQRRREYDVDQFDALLASLKAEVEAICRAQGYFDCQIETGGDARRAYVKVEAGPRTKVSEAFIDLQGPIDDDPALHDQLLRRWAMPVGQPYEAALWESSKRDLLNALEENGFLRARIAESKVTVDVQQATAVLRLVIVSGPRVRFGDLQIHGLQRYSRPLVEGLRPYRDGADYSYDLLQQFQANLRDSGYFTNAYVMPDMEALERNPDATEVPLKLELTEEQVKRATYGIGYGTDAGVRLILGLEHRNLFGRGDRMDSGVILEQDRQRAFVGVRTPTDSTGHYWAYGARYDRIDVAGQKTGTATLYGGRGKRRGHIETFTSLAHQNESQAIDLGGGNTEYRHARATALGYSWNYRSLDSRIDPREGFSISAQASAAVKGLITDTSFLRLYTRSYYFLPLNREFPNKAGVFVGRLDLGQVFASTTQGIPSTNLFRTGGTQTLRGYDFNTIGVDRGAATVGGRVLGVASLEYQHPITDAIWGATFFDVGGAALSWGDFRTYRSYGVGVRLRTPVGPINLDAAYADNHRAFRFQFSVGFLF